MVGGGGTEGEIARGGVSLRLAFFDTGDKEAGEDWVPGFDEAAFFLREDFAEACFFVLGVGSIIVSHADFEWGFVVDPAVVSWWSDALRDWLLVEGLISLALL